MAETEAIQRGGETGIAEPLADLERVAEAARRSYENARAPRTNRGYALDWGVFTRWCERHGATPLPATAGVIVAYINALAIGEGFLPSTRTGRAERSPKTIARHLAAIRRMHLKAGIETSPTVDFRVKESFEGIARSWRHRPDRKAAAVAHLLERMVRDLPITNTVLRDRALLLLGFMGAFRSSELVSLSTTDLDFVRQGLVVTLRRSKTDQTGVGRAVMIPYGREKEICAVTAVKAAARDLRGRAVQDDDGIPLFVSYSRARYMRRMRANVVNDIVKRQCAVIGLDPTEFGSHSMRAGMITSAAEAGRSLPQIIEITGHRKLDTLRDYIRRHGSWDDVATKGLL